MKIAGTSGGALQRYRGWYSDVSERFKLGQHYTIDRFGIKITALAVLGALVLTLTGYGAVQAGKEQLGTQSLFTPEFMASRSGAMGTVDGVYRNREGTRALVVFSFENPSMMSTDAKDYYSYVSGMSSGRAEKVDTPMAGQIYSFGTTGTMALMLEAPDGFESQQLNITMRAENELSPPVADPGQGRGGAWAQYDQWRMVVNPGASETRWLAALDSQVTPSPEALYADAVLWTSEQDQRRRLDQMLSDLKTQSQRIENYHEQMETTSVRIGEDPGVRLLPPSLPEEMLGDEITGLSSTELRAELESRPADQIEGIAEKTDRARLIDTYTDGTVPNTYRLIPGKIMSAGLDFDWRSRTVSEGYFDRLGTGASSISEYLAELQTSKVTRLSARDLKWPLTNGSDLSEARVDASASALLELRNNAIAAYDAYFKIKRDYQTYGLVQLLVMESRLEAIGQTSTVVAGSDAVEVRQ